MQKFCKEGANMGYFKKRLGRGGGGGGGGGGAAASSVRGNRKHWKTTFKN